MGVATHEIGHALGFLSGVDQLDYFGNPKNGGPFNDNQLPFVNTLDLFRYSTDSKNLGAIDGTADTRDKYFSLDGGTNKIASFATGVDFGDGQQASHWKDNLGLGIMDPTFARGELGIIRENDLRAFDVIGYNRASITATAVPELGLNVRESVTYRMSCEWRRRTPRRRPATLLRVGTTG